jgi:hypothetical protein
MRFREDIFAGRMLCIETFVPKDTLWYFFFEAIFEYQDVIHYENMLIIDYNKAVFLMSNFLLDNGF